MRCHEFFESVGRGICRSTFCEFVQGNLWPVDEAGYNVAFNNGLVFSNVWVNLLLDDVENAKPFL